MPTFIPAGSCAWISGIASRTCPITSSELAVGRTQMPMNVAGLAVEAHVLVVVLGAEHDVGDLAEAHDDALLLLDDELPELLRRLQVGVRDEVDRDHRALGLARAPRGSCSGASASRTCGRRDAQRRHLVGLQPDAHGEGARAEDVGPLDAADRGELGLDDARQVVGDLVLVEVLGREAEVHRGELVVRRLELDDRRLGLRRQVVADLGDLGLDLRSGRRWCRS